MKSFARELRQNQTDAEAKIWQHLRNRQLLDQKFRRQYKIGPYVADFCCLDKGLIVELDGSQHSVQKVYDRTRTEDLKGKGFRVLRFWDHDVLQNTDSVLEAIRLEIEKLCS